MKILVPVLAVAAFAFVAVDPNTSGPYTDSQGRVYDRLPSPSDFASVAEFDARFGHEVFTTRDGRRFQIDRELTPEELSQALEDQLIGRNWRNQMNSGLHTTASVSTNNPVDEEFRGAFSSIASLKNYVMGEVDVADAALIANWGIDLVPTTGQAWDSNDSADIVQLLDEAYAEHGLNGQDMMTAWSNDYTSGGAIGVAYIGLPRLLTKKYNGLEGEIMQHEVGHTYTCYHCNDNTCIMYPYLIASNLGNFHNYYESTSGQNHWNVMNNQKNRY